MGNQAKSTIGTAAYLDPSSDEIIKDIYATALAIYNVCKESEALFLHHRDKDIPLAEFSLFNDSVSQVLENTTALLKGIAESFDKTRRRL